MTKNRLIANTETKAITNATPHLSKSAAQQTQKSEGTQRTALVTGASRGIGYAIARALAKEGYHLHLTCIHSIEELRAFAVSLSSEYGIICTAHQVDASDAEAVTELFSGISELDVLVNNAGISHVGLLHEMTVPEWDQLIQTNLSSLFYTSRHAIPFMLKKHSGHIINISSVWGNVGASMEVAYSASKGGINSFTKALAKELAPSHIQVNAISCGVIDTDMNKCFSPEEMKLLTEEIPADRLGQPDEVAQLLTALLHTPDYMTGQIITIDGGFC